MQSAAQVRQVSLRLLTPLPANTSQCVIANNAGKKEGVEKNTPERKAKRGGGWDHMHGQARLHVRIGNCTTRGIWAAKWETPEQLHSPCTNISTLRREWKQGGGGGGAQGEGCTDSSFTRNISPPRLVWKIREVNASCLMENKGSNLKPSASNTCALSLPSTAVFLRPDWYWNIIHLERRHVIIFPSGPFSSLPHPGWFQVVGMFHRLKSDWKLFALILLWREKGKKTYTVYI